MRRVLSAASIVCAFTAVALLIFHVIHDDGDNSFELIAHGTSSAASRLYRFDKIDNETLVVYRGRIRQSQTSSGSYAEGLFMRPGRRGMVVEEGFFAVLRREERTLTPGESRELMRLVREVERDAPEDFHIIHGGAWYAILRYNDSYYTAAVMAPIVTVSPPRIPRAFFDSGVSAVELLNKLVELSPFPTDISIPHSGS